MTIGAAAIRGLVGPLFIGHGTQKLFGWFGGAGLGGTSGMMESLELQPGRRHALTVGLAETVGGALLTIGALTPLATSLLSGTMVTAIRKVHAPKGPWNTEGGYEYNAVLIATLTALADHGPGRPSIDGKLFPRLHGAPWAAASLGAAVAGSFGVTAATARPEQPEPVPVPAHAGDGAAPREPVGAR